MYIYIVVLLLGASPASKKTEIYRSQNAYYSLGGANAIFVSRNLKKKVSCFTFSFVYEKIRKSMKK